MTVCFLLERGSPPRVNPVLTEVMDLLEARGVRVKRRYPEEELLRLDELAVQADLYLLKSDSELSLSLATALESLGARVLNCAAASGLVKNKVLTAATLRAAGVPAPRAFVAARAAQLKAKLSRSPLILKPARGYHGVGLAVAWTAADLPVNGAYPEIVFAQEYRDRARRDLKVFAIGERLFGVRKDFSPESFLRSGEPSPLSPEIQEIAWRCGRAFGLDLYGLDVVESEEGPEVVDVNYFPGYRGVPGASRHLAAYICQARRQ